MNLKLQNSITLIDIDNQMSGTYGWYDPFYSWPTIIPKSSKGPDDQPKKINQKKSTKKIKKKITFSKHHTTQFCNFYIGPDDQPKKINQKNQPKKSTQKIKKKSPYLNTILHNFATST